MPQNHKNTHKNINAYKNKVNSALLIYLHYIYDVKRPSSFPSLPTSSLVLWFLLVGSNKNTRIWICQTDAIARGALRSSGLQYFSQISKETSTGVFLVALKAFQDLTQDLNLGGDIYASYFWSVTNVKKYCLQIGLLCSALFLV